MNASQKKWSASKVKAHLALLAVTIFYSCNFIIAQDLMQGSFVPPFALVALRVFGAGFLFWVFHSLFINESISKRDLPYLLLCSFFAIVLAQNTFLLGLERTPTINASLIVSTTPILVALFSVLVLKDKLTRSKIIGLGLAAIGTMILLLSKGRFDTSNQFLWGNVLMFLNAATFGLYLVLIKPLLSKYHPLTVIKWVFAFSSPLVLMMSYNELSAIHWAEFTTYAWIGLFYVIIFATFFTYAFNAYAIKILSPVIAGLYLYLQPFLTTLLSVTLGKDQLTSYKVVAGIFILSGLYYATRKTFPRNT